MKKDKKPYWIAIFPSSIGWFAILGHAKQIKELSFGYKSAKLAKGALSQKLVAQARLAHEQMPLVRRFQEYAEGAVKDDFRDLRLDLSGYSEFQRKTLQLCRNIPFGTTLSYGALAARLGSPNAARAVGGCMARNHIPIIIPCHRVVPASGGLGSYSAPGGVSMKKRLLNIENASI
jgi:methylated-DNA-[protein]-cysteine S-methyltransferase